MHSYIIKFGGSSVGTPECISSVLDIVSDTKNYAPGTLRSVVVSAFQGVTDQLIATAHKAALKEVTFKEDLQQIESRHLQAVEVLIPPKNRSAVLATIKVLFNELSDVVQGISLVGECTPRSMDLVMSFGERLSATVVTEAAKARGIPAEYLDTRSLIVTDDSFGRATLVKEESYSRIQSYFSSTSTLQIATGFIAATSEGATSTLGRGGSDYTASILGAALQTTEIHIWTDVDGMLTADPRKVPKAFPIPEVSVDEAMELCHFGAKVIYPPTIQPAVDSGVPLVIRNTFSPSSQGTRITNRTHGHPHPITGITSISDIALLRIQGSGMVGIAGVAMRFFKALAARKINVILITQASSEHTICCAIDPKNGDLAREGINEEFGLEIAAGLIAPLVVEENLAIISVVGEKMRSTPGMSGRVFAALGRNGINVVAIAQGSSELNISAVIPKRDETKGLNALHDEFFVGSTKTIHLWLVGTGLIGGTLLQQIERQRENLRVRHGLEINLQGVGNSRWMRLATEHSSESLVLTPPSEKDTPFSLRALLNHLGESSRSNEIFVDCTSSNEIPNVYPELLSQSIPVVTPNKKGLAGELSDYQKCKEISIRRRTPFLHETTVGAGLPILNTLSDLVRSGDTLVKIEAVLSGTLSYIFNALALGVQFADAVREAKRLGLTEPDPRDDLSGLDVARKVLILSREGGLPLQLDDIKKNAILPEECSHWSAEEFLNRLDELNSHFCDLVEKASSEGRRPYFSATINFQEKSAEIGIVLHPEEHPFSALSGSDNIVAFTTERYRSQPLVVKGPGAGAEVTAAGVFADIIRIAH